MDLSPIIRVELTDDGYGYGYGDLDDRKLLDTLSERDRMDLSPVIRVAFPSRMQFLRLPSKIGFGCHINQTCRLKSRSSDEESQL